jgi:lipid-A-disaccharide synthase
MESAKALRRGPPPRVSVALELLRALGGIALLPARLADFVACREALAAELASDLEASGAAPDVRKARAPARPLRVFVSSAEASGEIHAAGFVRAAQRQLAALGAPPAEWIGLGGARLRAEGVATLADPVARAKMGVGGALADLPYYLGLLERSALAVRTCDLAVLVDSPALHVPLGRIARRAGARAVHFVTPQFWGWAPWRASGYRKAFDLALTILPFEPSWFARRGVATAHVGHPLLDALPSAVPPIDAPERTALVLLPGSRRGVIERNLPWMLSVLARARARLGELEVVLPQADAALEPLLRSHVDAAGASSWVHVVPGELHACLARARAAFSVSGTVLLDLLHQRIPTVVIYRLGSPLAAQIYPRLVVAPWFAMPNLLAGRAVLPEFAFAGRGPIEEVAAALERCWADAAWRRQCQRGLELAASRLGPPGACDRAASAALDLAAEAPT